MKIKNIIKIFFFLFSFNLINAIEITKELEFQKHTLPDVYTARIGNKKYERKFQWDKMKTELETLQGFLNEHTAYGYLRNYKNFLGQAPLFKGATVDPYGVPRNAAIPLYSENNPVEMIRYGRDGAFIGINWMGDKYSLINVFGIEGSYFVENRYIKLMDEKEIRKVVFVDLANQHAATLEKADEINWKVRSMNPVTTGLAKPPYSLATPAGVFAIQDKTDKMFYLKEGTKDVIEGYAPHAARFSRGAYLHGFPVVGENAPTIEYSETLGTTPRSHMCVRNATSHAQFLYGWTEIGNTLVFVF